MIDPRAIIDPTARLGRDVHIGPWSIVGPQVEIGDDCWIGPHVVLHGPTRLGKRNHIFQFATVGEGTPAVAYRGEPTTLEIGDDNVIREGVTIHRGTVQDRCSTTIGNNNLLMAYVHVAHDCVLGSNIIMANNASVSGHCAVGDYANFGGYSGVPPRRSVGAHAMIGGMSLVVKDVPAFVTVSGNPAAAIGINVEGMRRRQFAADAIEAMQECYRVVYRSSKTVRQALISLAPLAERYEAVALFLASIEGSKFGVVRPRRQSRLTPE